MQVEDVDNDFAKVRRGNVLSHHANVYQNVAYKCCAAAIENFQKSLKFQTSYLKIEGKIC